MVTASPCMRCGGAGQAIEHPCDECRGEGRVVKDKTYTVDIPAGVDTGSTLRLTGRGAAGPRGGGLGDLYVHVRVQPDDRFERDGYDLTHQLHVSAVQAMLGVELDFETLDGTEHLIIPRGTQPGRVFRLRGRGVPHVEGRGRGDLMLEVVVDVPTDLSPEQEELARQLAELRGDDVAPPGSRLLGKIRSAFT
jgi:molecular chaperone DnaJ